jgi:glycerol uptake facilitator-like aquaporin
MNTPAEFSWTTAAIIFVTYVVIDILYALYVICVSKRQPFNAALTSSFLYSLAAYGVISYSKNPAYIVPLAIGAFIGTYVVVKYNASE